MDSIEVVLPIKLAGRSEKQKALVNISQLISFFKLAEACVPYTQKFWNIMEQQKMDKTLMPDDIREEPVSAKE